MTPPIRPPSSPPAALVALIAAMWLASPSASAQPTSAAQTSSLSWSRLEGSDACIGTGELARSVEALLGRAVFVSAAQAEVSVEGRVEPQSSGGWRAVISMSDRDGKSLGDREISSQQTSCRSLDEPVALAIALMIDPEAALGPPPPPPEQPPAEPPPPKEPEVIVKDKPVYVPVPADRPAEPEEDPWHFAVRGGPIVGAGLLPTVGLGATGAVIVEPPWFLAVEGSAAVYLPMTEEIDGAFGDFQLAYVGLAVCPLTRRYERLYWSLCVEVQLGRLWVDGEDHAGASWEDHQFIANIATRARGGFRMIGPLTLGLGFAGAIPLLRESFEVVDASGASVELFRLSPVVALPELSLELHWP